MPRKSSRSTKKNTTRKSKALIKKPRFILNPFPAVMRIRMRTLSDLLAYAPAATTGTLNFNMNSINDPFGTLDDNQPMYYDQLSLIYGKYKVLSAYYTLTLVNTTADLCEVGTCIHEIGSLPTTVREAVESLGGHYFQIGATDENISNKKVIKGGYKLAKMAGKSLADASYSANISNDPAEKHQLVVMLSSANNISIKYRMEMYQYVELYEVSTVAAAEDA